MPKFSSSARACWPWPCSAAHDRRRDRPDQRAPAARRRPQPPAPADPAKVVARANGVDITEGDLAIANEDPALQIPGVPDAQKRDLLVGYLIDLKLGAQAAAAAKVGDSPNSPGSSPIPATRRFSTITSTRNPRRP